MRWPTLLVYAALPALLPAPASAVVVSEIHYHPPAGDEALEFVELANEFATPEDLSGYAFTEGISFRFAPGTILGPRGILVVAGDAAALKARYGIDNVVGDFGGRLDAGGDRLTLVSHAGVVVQSLRYRDRGKWPTGPDGT
ncbi:MAG: lamin tail domain-containing protein, partial [Thermoanaerobaculia bacterium]